MKEIWKDIKEYEGIYQISNLGRVRRLKKWCGNVYKSKWIDDIKILTPTDNGNGYKIISLNKNRKRKNKYIHRLVAEAFIPNPDNLPEVNHIDNNKSNNVWTNLEWCTRSYNVKYSFDKGFHVAPKNMLGRKGKNHPISKSVKQYDLEGNFIKEYGSAHIASQETNVCYASIKKCRCKKQKTAGGYIWTY